MLVPESNAGGEVGWRWQFAKQSELSLSSYFQHYHNLIFLEQQSTGSVKSVNALRAHVRGENLNDNRTPDLSGFNYTGIAFYGGMYVDY